MFDIERWQEIFDTIRKNKLRTFLTGLSVASGIFILVILLGFGEGMQNGVTQEFEEDAVTSVHVWAGVTSKEYKGMNPGRRIQLRNENFESANQLFKEDLEYKSARTYINGVTINYGKESLSYGLQGVSPDFQFVENARIIEGRFINENDAANTTKVAVIGYKIKLDVFRSVETPIGEFIDISGIPFKIVGIYSETEDREEERIYIPLNTSQKVFNGADRIGNLAFTLPPAENFKTATAEAVQFKENLRTHLQQVHTIAPEDSSALNVFSMMEIAQRYYNLIDNIKFFFWFVGICTVIAGIVGVSNIMLIVVKERTREIGIRKAIGAKPWAIVGLILQESIFVTAISGFSGFIFSMGLLEIFGPYIEVDYIVNPSVNFKVALSTVFLLIIAGALAGFFPAWRAANVHTIKALKDE
ncbi:MAG: ABC transporter permease [Eudoraea sp.]|nr:ABC transporter permease [Eudoraea sp.]